MRQSTGPSFVCNVETNQLQTQIRILWHVPCRGLVALGGPLEVVLVVERVGFGQCCRELALVLWSRGRSLRFLGHLDTGWRFRTQPTAQADAEREDQGQDEE